METNKMFRFSFLYVTKLRSLHPKIHMTSVLIDESSRIFKTN